MATLNLSSSVIFFVGLAVMANVVLCGGDGFKNHEKPSWEDTHDADEVANRLAHCETLWKSLPAVIDKYHSDNNNFCPYMVQAKYKLDEKKVGPSAGDPWMIIVKSLTLAIILKEEKELLDKKLATTLDEINRAVALDSKHKSFAACSLGQGKN